MKKIYLVLIIILAASATPALAATKAAAKTAVKTVAAKEAWKPSAPSGYAPITWAKAPGIASFFRMPEDNGTIDFLTRIYLPQNQIGFVGATSTPIDLDSPDLASGADSSDPSMVSGAGIDRLHNLSFQRLGAESAKAIAPSVKFIWDAPFFNMKPVSSDLSLALKYSVGTTTTITRGSRSVPDMAQPRRLLVINNQAGSALIKDFDPEVFMDEKSGDQAIEGFAPTVAKTDSASAAASRLFLGVSDDGRELAVYCSRLATVEEASQALAAAGISPDHQLEADGGGSTACGYNLPGQFFVEPTRTLPLLMGAQTILARGRVTEKLINVRRGPSTKNAVVTQLPKGTAVRAFEENNGWYRIGDNEWILKSLIK